jgi:phosphinothricin acetyltransferase
LRYRRITLPNDASIALHEKLGFAKAAQLNEIGYKLEQWIDVGYWELLL